MKILIDLSFVSPKTKNDSIPIAYKRMLEGVPDSERSNFKLLFDKGCADVLHRVFPNYEYITVNVWNMRKVYYDPRLFFVPFSMRRAINNSGCDAVFFPADGNMYVKHKLKIPSVVVINDMKWLKKDTTSPKLSLKSIALRMLNGDIYNKYKNTIENASLITTASQYTKDDLLRFFPDTPSEKIHVIYQSVPAINESKKPEGILEGEKYVLNVNSILPFKNPLTLLKAFALMTDLYNGKLVLVGRTTDHWTNELVPFIKQNQLADRVVHLENLDETEVRYLYENADLFVTPSFHEGFGLTPVEAAIYGCPVICSKCESLPEATMGLVTYYEPAKDEQALYKAMVEVLKSPPSEERRNEISRTFLERYTARRHAEDLIKLFGMLKN